MQADGRTSRHSLNQAVARAGGRAGRRLRLPRFSYGEIVATQAPSCEQRRAVARRSLQQTQLADLAHGDRERGEVANVATLQFGESRESEFDVTFVGPAPGIDTRLGTLARHRENPVYLPIVEAMAVLAASSGAPNTTTFTDLVATMRRSAAGTQPAPTTPSR